MKSEVLSPGPWPLLEDMSGFLGLKGAAWSLPWNRAVVFSRDRWDARNGHVASLHKADGLQRNEKRWKIYRESHKTKLATMMKYICEKLSPILASKSIFTLASVPFRVPSFATDFLGEVI